MALAIQQPICGMGNVINLFAGREKLAPTMKYRVEGDALYSPGAPFSVRSGEVLLCRTDFLPHEVTCRRLAIVRVLSTGRVYARFLCDHPSYTQAGKILLKPVNLSHPAMVVEQDDYEVVALVERRAAPRD